uniref:Transmembrane protein n=1 Tax=Medicago truncatula TaxID=3880 RepID=B7FJA7_MEDTR|nr:unknown [Medicago truncatula]
MITKYFSLRYRITIVQINLAHSSIFFLFTVIIASDLFIILLYLIHDINKHFIITFTHHFGLLLHSKFTLVLFY